MDLRRLLNHMQRRSFFRSLLGTAVAGATVAAAKPSATYNPSMAGDGGSGKAILPRGFDYPSATPLGGWMCRCGGAMLNDHNGTMYCTIPECKFYQRAVRVPLFHTQGVDSHEYVLVRHAMIILGLIRSDEEPSAADAKLGIEVLRGVTGGPMEWRRAKEIHPFELAQQLKPYYGLS